jgi:hypothetical protein
MAAESMRLIMRHTYIRHDRAACVVKTLRQRSPVNCSWELPVQIFCYAVAFSVLLYKCQNETK